MHGEITDTTLRSTTASQAAGSLNTPIVVKGTTAGTIKVTSKIATNGFVTTAITKDDNISLTSIQPNLVSSNIKAGTSIFGISGKSSVVETSDANAALTDVLAGKTAYVNGTKITGNIQTITPSGITLDVNGPTVSTTYIVKKGYVSNDVTKTASTVISGGSLDTPVVARGTNNGTIKVTSKVKDAGYVSSSSYKVDDNISLTSIQPNLVSSNIKAGTSIFGISGKSSVVETSDANAALTDVLAGKTAYVNGTKITGNIQTITPSGITLDVNGPTVSTTYIVKKGYIAADTPITKSTVVASAQLITPEINKTGSTAGTINIISKVNAAGYVSTTTKTDNNVSLTSIQPNLVSSNIKAGTTIFGISGKQSVKDTSDANATSNDILAGKTAYVNGTKITGVSLAETTAAGKFVKVNNQTWFVPLDGTASSIVENIYIPNVTGEPPAYPGNIGFMFNGVPKFATSCFVQPISFTSGTTDFSCLFSINKGSSQYITCYPKLEKVGYFDTSAGTNFNYMCYGCSSLIDFAPIDTSAGVNFVGMFNGCSALSALPAFDVSSVTSSGSLNGMFTNCSQLRDFGGLLKCKCSYSLNTCTNLTQSSLVNCLNGLEAVSLSNRQTLTLGETLLNKLTSSQKSIATSKNWYLA